MNFHRPSNVPRTGLYLLLAAFIFLGGVYSVVTPLFEASDELWHYPMVKTLADGNGLPVQDPSNPGPWRQEGSQPPLYYAVGALTTSWIDTSDISQVRRLNPHADNGIITQDGNNNIVVHNALRERWPWAGTVLAVHIVRLLSVLMSAGTVYFTYRAGEELFSHHRWLALAGASAVAFNPMFLFISGSVNNDNLSVFLSAVAIWLMLGMLRAANAGQSMLRWSLALGLCLGLAALSKQSTLGLFFVTGLALAYSAWKRGALRPLFTEGASIAVIATAIAGWWYYRNWVLYKDISGLNTFLDIVGRRSPPASLLQLWGERVGFVQSYWGLFGGVSLPMADWAYMILNATAVLAAIGLIAMVIRVARRGRRYVSSWAAAALTLVWIPAVVLPLIFGWTRYTWASQGRLIFAAIGSLSLWLMAGLGGPFPARWGKLGAGAATIVMANIAIIAPHLWIAPHYMLRVTTVQPAVTADFYFTPPGSAHPVMKLAGYTLDTAPVHPGDSIKITLYWKSLAAMDRDWSVFVHLEDSAQLIEGQRDTYPGLGLMATSELKPNFEWADTYVVPISASAYSPESLRIVVGLYDLQSGQRMMVSGGADAATLGEVPLLPSGSADNLPNPVEYNFADQLSLVGYTIKQRRVHPGDNVELSLYWRARRPPSEDYTLSVQIFNQAGEKRGQVDQPLLNVGKTTRNWTPNTVVNTMWSVPLAPDAGVGPFTIRLVVYWIDPAGSLQRLQLVTSDGRLSDPFLSLAKLMVVP